MDTINRRQASRDYCAGPVLKQQQIVRYQPVKAVGPIRCRSAPVGSSLSDTGHVQVIDSQTAEGKDYFNQLFETHQTIDNNNTLIHLPGHVSVEHSFNTCTASSTCDVRILEVAGDGKYVRIINTSSSRDYELGNYIIQQNVRGHAVSVFRFPPRVNLPTLTAVTVWSESGKHHKSLSHYLSLELVFKGHKKWIAAPYCTTVLCRPNGQAIAWYTAARKHTDNDVSTSQQADDNLQSQVQSRSNISLFASVPTDTSLEQPAGCLLSHLPDQPSTKTRDISRPNSVDSGSQLQSRCSTATTRIYADYIPGLQFAGAPAQRLGSASLRRYTPPRPLSATLYQPA